MRIEECKTKGTGLLSTKKYFDQTFGQSYFKNKWNLYYPGMSQNIMASSWYDLEPNIRWHYDSAVDAKKNIREYFIELSQFAVRNDLNGVYKFFIKLGGLKRFLNVAPQFATAYLNCVKMKMLVNKDGFFQTELICPKFTKEWLICGHEGTYGILFEIFGNQKKEFKIVKEDIFFTDDEMEFCKVIYEMKYT